MVALENRCLIFHIKAMNPYESPLRINLTKDSGNDILQNLKIQYSIFKLNCDNYFCSFFFE